MKTYLQNIFLPALKKIYITFLFLLTGYLGYNQVGFGVKSGINIATTKDLIEFPKNRIGWYAGVAAVIPLHKFFLQPELLFSSKGNGVDQINLSETVLKFNYLTVPILFGYKIDRKTSLLFGPEFGYLISAAMIYGNNENLDVSKNYSPKFDAGLDIGLKYNIIKNISIEVRYNYGFKILYYTDYGGVVHNESKGANRVFQIGLAYLFQNIYHNKKFHAVVGLVTNN